MPTKRKKLSGGVRRIDISDAVIQAWRAGDYWGVHHGLGLRPWQMPHWNADLVETDDRPDNLRRAYPAPDPRALKPVLVELGGPPPEFWWFNEKERDSQEPDETD